MALWLSKPLKRLVLASTSPFRRDLLERLGLPFELANPGTDEAEIAAEVPPDRARRLAAEKARACAATDAVVIGADQVAARDGQILHKPGNAKRNFEQLLACQGRTVDFHTAVAVLTDDHLHCHVDHTRVVFRRLPRASLEHYITLDQPFGCAGGFRAEGIGIALFERIESVDPTALIGLPLIWLADALRAARLDPLAR